MNSLYQQLWYESFSSFYQNMATSLWKANLFNNTWASCHYWLVLIKGTLEATVPQCVASQEMGEGFGMVVGFGLKTCVMWGLWQSAHNGLASLNSNLHSTQKNTHGRAAHPLFLQSVCPSHFVSVSACLPPRYSIYLTGFRFYPPTSVFIGFYCLYPTKTCTIFLLLTLQQPHISYE